MGQYPQISPPRCDGFSECDSDGHLASSKFSRPSLTYLRSFWELPNLCKMTRSGWQETNDRRSHVLKRPFLVILIEASPASPPGIMGNAAPQAPSRLAESQGLEGSSPTWPVLWLAIILNMWIAQLVPCPQPTPYHTLRLGFSMPPFVI